MNGKIALVTGASKGIGRGIAYGLADAGWDVAVHYHSDAAGADETKKIIEGKGRRCLTLGGDVGEKCDVERMVAAVIAEFGPSSPIKVRERRGEKAAHYEPNTATIAINTIGDINKFHTVTRCNHCAPATSFTNSFGPPHSGPAIWYTITRHLAFGEHHDVSINHIGREFPQFFQRLLWRNRLFDVPRRDFHGAILITQHLPFT
jgi:NAD(P)-dependent dehydrogenase (short-subunit alcohol dehydrogenase family)